MIELIEHSSGVILLVRAHAGARKNGILGERDGMLRVAVTAAPEKGKANKAIVALLAKTLGIAKTSIELIAGETSPQKRFLIAGGNIDAIHVLLARLTAK